MAKNNGVFICGEMSMNKYVILFNLIMICIIAYDIYTSMNINPVTIGTASLIFPFDVRIRAYVVILCIINFIYYLRGRK